MQEALLRGEQQRRPQDDRPGGFALGRGAMDNHRDGSGGQYYAAQFRRGPGQRHGGQGGHHAGGGPSSSSSSASRGNPGPSSSNPGYGGGPYRGTASYGATGASGASSSSLSAKKGRVSRSCLANFCLSPSTVVILYLVVLVFSSASERIAFKVMLDTLRPFRFFLAQLVMLAYVPIMFAVVAYKKLRTDHIQPEMEEFPKCKFAFMALMDVMQVVIVMISGGVIPAPLTVLLLQSLIPATMIASRIFLGNRYRWQHYFGALIILASISVNMIPLISQELRGDGGGSSSGHHNDTEALRVLADGGGGGSSSGSSGGSNFPPQPTASEIAWNSLIYFLCCVPGAVSAVYKESALKAQPMDVYYLNAWVAFFQFIVSIPFAPIAFHFQEWSSASTTKWSDFRYLFENIGMGFDCWLFGVDPPHTYADQTPVLGAAYVHCNVSRMFFPELIWYVDLVLVFLSHTHPISLYPSASFFCSPLFAGRAAPRVLLHRGKHDVQHFCDAGHQTRVSHTDVRGYYCGCADCVHCAAILPVLDGQPACESVHLALLCWDYGGGRRPDTVPLDGRRTWIGCRVEGTAVNGHD